MTDQTNTEVPENTGAQINLADLQNLLRILDVAAECGTFKGNELSSVGNVRDRLAAFIEASQQAEAEVNETAAAGETPAN
jgi:hypothetical protein